MITGGPLRGFKIGTLDLDPVDDSPAEYELDGTDFETKRTTTKKNYSTGKEKAGMVKQECVFDSDKAEAFTILKNSGAEHAGNATLPDGRTLNFNAVIEGEHQIVDGKVTVFIVGTVEFA